MFLNVLLSNHNYPSAAVSRLTLSYRRKSERFEASMVDSRLSIYRIIHTQGYTSFFFYLAKKGCGAYRSDRSSCIPNRLLRILFSYPLHARLPPVSSFASFSICSPVVPPSRFLFLSVSHLVCRCSCAVYRGEQYSSHLNILRAVSRVPIRMLRRCCRKS